MMKHYFVCYVLLSVVVVLRGAVSPKADDAYFDLGTFTRAVHTADPEAQKWFDRGLVLTYGFNHEEASRCFERAIEADAECAMAYWGRAYAVGPNINNTEMDASASRLAWESVKKAAELSVKNPAPEKEGALIAALEKRYAWPAPEDRSLLDRAYADAMRTIYLEHPNDPDVAALFAESLMNLRPWNHWAPDGKAAPETPEIEEVLVGGLAVSSDHPGLCHLYIHLMEASPMPEVALPAANRLRDLIPDAGHLLHMPSHIDVLLGRYPEAILANREAIAADQRFVAREGRHNFYTLYRIHNYHFIVYAAMFDGQSEVAMMAAERLVKEIPPELLTDWVDFLDAFVPTPLHVMVRFGRWEQVLETPEPAEELYFSRAIWHYARTLALASLRRPGEAEIERQELEQVAARVPSTRILFNNTCQDILGVARAMALGEVEYRLGNHQGAFTALRRAVALDDALHYDEPWGWMQPARHALGALLLEQGFLSEAESVYRADLKRHPRNGWALHGLSECLRRTGQGEEASEIEARLEDCWKRSDTKLIASCYCRIDNLESDSDASPKVVP